MKYRGAAGVIAPSFPLKPEYREDCIRVLENLGYRVKLGNCAAELRSLHGYLAGDGRARAEDINRMFADPEVRVIFCVRGGYGAAHTIPYLNFDLIRRNPKPLIGFSDITNLHLALNRYTGITTFHGPMLVSNLIFDFDEYTRESLFSALEMKAVLEFKNPPGEELETIRPGCAEGIVLGGNLAVMARTSGTPWQLDGRGKILLLEEVDEPIPLLDMYLTQLEQSGAMRGIKGILLGSFTGCSNERYDAAFCLNEFFKERFSQYSVPILCQIKTGHDKPMGTMPMGVVCRMDTDKKSIIFLR